jgi:4-azaleucine resistance transporter AzlC
MDIPLTSPRLPMFWEGIKAELPLLIGVFPFGMIYGVLALEAGIPAGGAQAMSAIVFAGSSQFVTTQLVGNGAPAVIMILTIFIVNLRHALYSASIAPYISKLSAGWKALLAYLLTDEAYAISIVHYDQFGASPTSHWYFLGAGLALWTTWQISTAIGILVGAVIPAAWSLDFTLALTFIALLMPLMKDRPSLGAALSAGLIALLTINLPYKLGLVLAAFGGILIGILLEKWK